MGHSPAFEQSREFLPDEALDKIEALIPNVMQNFDLDNVQAYKRTIVATFKFDDDGDPFDRAQSLTNLIQAAMCIDTLVKNLRDARDAS